MLFRTHRSRPVVDASASAAEAPGSRGVGRYDGDGVVLGVDSCGRVEL